MKYLHYLPLILFINIGMPIYAHAKAESIQNKLAALESSTGVRLGISAINTANNQTIHYRAEERFPIQSTFKLIGVSAVLHQSMENSKLLQEKVTYKKQDLVAWSPMTEKNLKSGMTISELCAAAMMYSDDTAINLLVKKLGGLSAVTSFARLIGDNKFILNHWEPNMNSNPSDMHDTSTPSAMEKDLQKLAFGNILAPQREQLIKWMKDNTTGDTRIRAGVPYGWVVADRTGAGKDFGISNDIGILWPPKCAPVIVAIYSVQNKKNATRRDDVIVSATRIIIQEFSSLDRCLQTQ